MIEVPESNEPPVIADWAELSCLFGDRESVSRAQMENALEDAGIADADMAVADIWQEIDRRHGLAEQGYPFRALKGRIERQMQWNDRLAYTFQLLLASHSHYRSTKMEGERLKKAAKLFEMLSTAALQSHLGGRAINIGAPREAEVPKGFKQCLDYVCQQLNEMRGPVSSYNVSTKDDHVDIVAWRPFPDKRSGQIIIIAQCAAGAEWKSKAGEISHEVWRDYINWTASPLLAFAFPFICVDDMQWIHLSKQNRGFLLDRLRIASAFTNDNMMPDRIQDSLTQWCRSQTALLPLID